MMFNRRLNAHGNVLLEMRSIEIQRRNSHSLKWMELIRRYSFHSPLPLSHPSSIQLYCRRVCQLGKLFISSKTLVDEVETFLFYILVEHTNDGCEFVGYFSKVRRGKRKGEGRGRMEGLQEKNPSKNNNLSCILTLPSAMRSGYGRLLIDLSEWIFLLNRN